MAKNDQVKKTKKNDAMTKIFVHLKKFGVRHFNIKILLVSLLVHKPKASNVAQKFPKK